MKWLQDGESSRHCTSLILWWEWLFRGMENSCTVGFWNDKAKFQERFSYGIIFYLQGSLVGAGWEASRKGIEHFSWKWHLVCVWWNQALSCCLAPKRPTKRKRKRKRVKLAPWSSIEDFVFSLHHEGCTPPQRAVMRLKRAWPSEALTNDGQGSLSCLSSARSFKHIGLLNMKGFLETDFRG